jgi:hypothetical protein
VLIYLLSQYIEIQKIKKQAFFSQRFGIYITHLGRNKSAWVFMKSFLYVSAKLFEGVAP